jgi:ethanolamine utilization protein EutN
MQLATIIGRATATVKHASLEGWKLAVAQPLDASGGADGDPLLVIDNLGSGRGDKVIISSDGESVRNMVGSNRTPIRWAVMGVADE